MNIDCLFVDAAGREHRINTLVIWHQLNCFPRMLARIEDVNEVQAGPLSFSLRCATNATAALRTLAQSRWYVHRRASQRITRQILLELGPEPRAHLQVQPFAANGASTEDLLKPLLHPTDLKLTAPPNAPTIEALVSCGETLEQLADRLGVMTDSVYRLKPLGPERWDMEWAESLNALSLGTSFSTSVCQAHELVCLESPIEPALQRVGIPSDAAGELLRTGDAGFSESSWQPVQLGWPGAQAVSFGPPQNLDGEPLHSLLADWAYITDIEQIPPLWAGARVDVTDDVRRANTLASLFVYGGESTVRQASQALEQVLGGRAELHDMQGWLCASLTVRPGRTPRSSKLVRRLIEQARAQECQDQVVRAMGLPAFTAPAGANAPRFDNLPAVVVKNPMAPDKGPLTHTEDGLRYRTKIWVQILGVRGAVEVDWAIPFASHDNVATGGTLGGDMILVPAEFTYGFVSWVHAAGAGAPFFFATTHYRDAPVSKGIGQDGYTHGLVTHKGLLVHERSTNIEVVAYDTLNSRAFNTYHRSGDGN